MKAKIQEAVRILKNGGLVAFPTETVYGLGADASNPVAVKKIFQAKGRPSDHPLIVHIGSINQLSQWAMDISENALLLAKQFWPGPLTLILNKNPDVSDLITGGQNTIGIRIPNHPVALELLNEFGGGLAAPSANRFGHISPTTANAVNEELNGAVDLILDGGQCDVGVESTIVDVSGDQCSVLRPGIITTTDISTTLKKPLLYKTKTTTRVSGSMESHYAPTTKTLLINPNEIEKLLTDASQDYALLSQQKNLPASPNIYQISNDPKQYAHDLYAILRKIDKLHYKIIYIEDVPNGIEWDAIRDRITKASLVNKY